MLHSQPSVPLAAFCFFQLETSFLLWQSADLPLCQVQLLEAPPIKRHGTNTPTRRKEPFSANPAMHLTIGQYCRTPAPFPNRLSALPLLGFSKRLPFQTALRRGTPPHPALFCLSAWQTMRFHPNRRVKFQWVSTRPRLTHTLRPKGQRLFYRDGSFPLRQTPSAAQTPLSTAK